MERIAELLARLADIATLSDDELRQVETELRQVYDELREGEVDSAVLEQLASAVDGLDTIAAEDERREQERIEVARQVEELDQRVAGEATPTEPETPPEEGEQSEGEEEAEEEKPAEPGQAETEPAVVAAGRARVRVPRRSLPVVNDDTPDGVRILAAPDLPNRSAGATFGSWDEVAEAMCQRLSSFRGDYNGPAQNVRVGTVAWDRPDDQHLVAESVQVNQRRLRDRIGVPAVVAAGGICGPLDVQYDIHVDVTAARPVRDSLPDFTADRGGIVYQPAIGIGDVDTSGADSAIGTVTAAEDAAGTVTKSIWCIPCSPQQTVTVDAIYERLCFSNFSDRYNPENMRAYQEITRAAWARIADRRILAAMRAQATAATANALTVNSLRALAYNAAYARAWYDDRYRLPDTVALVMYFPRWLLRMLAIDMAWQAPGDNTINFADAEVQAVVRNHGNARVVWTLESDVAGEDLTGEATPDFRFPASIKALAFPAGAFTFLDGGTLDFGIVRDSATNAANRFQTFFESFEAVAKTGYQPLNITMPLCLNGAAAALATQTCVNV